MNNETLKRIDALFGYHTVSDKSNEKVRIYTKDAGETRTAYIILFDIHYDYQNIEAELSDLGYDILGIDTMSEKTIEGLDLIKFVTTGKNLDYYLPSHTDDGMLCYPYTHRASFIFKEDAEYIVVPHEQHDYVYDYNGDFVFKTPYKLMETDYPYNNKNKDTRIICGSSDLQANKREIICANPDKYLSDEARCGLINEKGHLVTDVIYQGFGEEWIVNKYISAKKNGKYAYINKNGQVLTDFSYDFCNIDTDWMSHPNYDILQILISEIKQINGCLHFKTRKGVFDWNGEVIIPPIYKKIEIVDRFAERYGFDPTNADEVEKTKDHDKIYLTDFKDTKFVWTYRNGLERL